MLIIITKCRYNICLIVLSAFLVSSYFFSLSYPKIPIGWMAPFALVPLFIAVRKIVFSTEKNTAFSVCKKSFISIWLFGFIVQFISFFWTTQPFIYFGSVFPYLSYLVFVFLSLISAIYFCILFSPFIFSLWYENKFPHKKLFILPIACLITFFEMYFPRVFQWSFGQGLSSNVIWNQLASLFGFNTGSLFIFYISLSLSKISYRDFMPPLFAFFCRNSNEACKKTKVKIDTYKTIFIIGATLLIVTLFGIIRVYSLNKTFEQSKKFRIAFVQPNFSFDNFASLPLPSKKLQERNFEILVEMSNNALRKTLKHDGKKADLLVWPESTAPDFFFYTPLQIADVTSMSQAWKTPFLTQSYQLKKKDIIDKYDSNYLVWSSSAIVASSGLIRHFFQKWSPMAFGEEVPFENIFPFLGKNFRAHFKLANKVERGISYKALPVTKEISVTPFICFDANNQELAYLSAKKGGADFFINQANLVWMADSNAGLEISLLDQMRAIENGKSVLMSSNSGPSLAFDPLGRLIFAPTELLTQDINYVDMPIYKGKTLFQIVYHWPLTILGLLSLVYFIYSTVKYNKH